MGLDQGLAVKSVTAFAHTLQQSDSVDAMLDALASTVTHALDLAGSAVGLARGAHLTLATSTPPHLAAVEQAQHAAQAGPALSAHQTGRTVTIARLPEHADRWRHYCAAAERAGVRAVAAIPMRLHTESRGALDIYRAQPHTWTDQELITALMVSELATGYLLATTLQEQRKLCAQLQHALQSRVPIEQAKGFLAATENIAVEQAYQRIRRHARSHHTNVRAVAHAIVRLGLRP